MNMRRCVIDDALAGKSMVELFRSAGFCVRLDVRAIHGLRVSLFQLDVVKFVAPLVSPADQEHDKGNPYAER